MKGHIYTELERSLDDYQRTALGQALVYLNRAARGENTEDCVIPLSRQFPKLQFFLEPLTP